MQELTGRADLAVKACANFSVENAKPAFLKLVSQQIFAGKSRILPKRQKFLMYIPDFGKIQYRHRCKVYSGYSLEKKRKED